VPRRARWAHLLEDPTFRRWFRNLARGSEATAIERARVLYRFLRAHNLTPQQLVDMAKEDITKVEDMLMDFIDEQLEAGKSPGYVENYLAVRSWLEFNGIRLVRKIKVGNRNQTPTIEDERIPTKEELRKILCYASERARVSIALMAFSGLRPEVLGNMRGTDGLKVKDFPEMEIRDGQVVFKRIPTMIVVRPSLSKIGRRYITFLCEEGCEYLKAYLEKRMAMGEKLTPESPIIAVKPGYEKVGKGKRVSRHITTKNITREIREAMRPVFKWRPYVLRAYFDTQLMIAESRGKISHTYRQFFMGHKGGIEAVYTVWKKLVPTVIEDMRQAYARCEEFLTTRPKPREEDPALATIKTMIETGILDLSRPEVREYLLEKLKIKDLNVKIAKMRAERGLSEEEAIEAVICAELGIELERVKLMRNTKRTDPKKVITEDELERYLADGWDIDAVLPSGKIVMRKTC